MPLARLAASTGGPETEAAFLHAIAGWVTTLHYAPLALHCCWMGKGNFAQGRYFHCVPMAVDVSPDSCKDAAHTQ